MHIVHSVLCGGWGGLEQYPLTVAPGQEDSGHQVTIVTLAGSPLAKECQRLGRACVEVPAARFRRFDPGLISFLREFVKVNQVDLVHCHRSGELLAWRTALLGLRPRLVLTYHIGVPNQRDPFHAWLLARVGAVIAISKENAERMHTRLPVAAKKIHYLANGVAVETVAVRAAEGRARRNDIRRELTLEPEDFVVMAVGRLCTAKGVFDLLEAAVGIPHVRFVWAGSAAHTDEPDFEGRLRERIEQLGMQKRFVLLGARADVPQLLGCADAFVLPAHQEAFGLVYLEAMAAGLPVIGCRSGGVPDIITSEETGVLVPPRDVAALRAAILRVAGDAEFRNRLGMAGRTRCDAFAMNAHVMSLLRIYEQS